MLLAWARLHKRLRRISFLQPFSVSWKIFLHSVMDRVAEGGLKSIGNTMTVRKNLPEHREQLQKFLLNLKLPRVIASLHTL